jgi:hypothetical protein
MIFLEYVAEKNRIWARGLSMAFIFNVSAPGEMDESMDE